MLVAESVVGVSGGAVLLAKSGVGVSGGAVLLAKSRVGVSGGAVLLAKSGVGVSGGAVLVASSSVVNELVENCGWVGMTGWVAELVEDGDVVGVAGVSSCPVTRKKHGHVAKSHGVEVRQIGIYRNSKKS